jgi:hypothetical protein
MIGRKVVDFFAHQCGARDQLVAEREVVLTYALHLLSERRVLDRLAFKGGTALRKLVFGAGGRFSEDLDFTLRAGEKEDAALALLDALDGKTHHGITFGTTDFYETDGSFATSVSYRHGWNDKGRFKLDVSNRETPTLPVLPRPHVEQPYFAELEFGAPPAVAALDPLEMIEGVRRRTPARARRPQALASAGARAVRRRALRETPERSLRLGRAPPPVAAGSDRGRGTPGGDHRGPFSSSRDPHGPRATRRRRLAERLEPATDRGAARTHRYRHEGGVNWTAAARASRACTCATCT